MPRPVTPDPKHHKDAFGNMILVGDEAAFNPPIYKGLIKGRVINLTPKGCRIEYTINLTTSSHAVLGTDCVVDIKARRPWKIEPTD